MTQPLLFITLLSGFPGLAFLLLVSLVSTAVSVGLVGRKAQRHSWAIVAFMLVGLVLLLISWRWGFAILAAVWVLALNQIIAILGGG